jgi:hypothetical protein
VPKPSLVYLNPSLLATRSQSSSKECLPGKLEDNKVMLSWLTESSGTSHGSFTNPFEITSIKDFQKGDKLLIFTKGGYLFVVNQIELLLKEDHFESELKSYMATLIHCKNDSVFGLFL